MLGCTLMEIDRALLGHRALFGPAERSSVVTHRSSRLQRLEFSCARQYLIFTRHTCFNGPRIARKTIFFTAFYTLSYLLIRQILSIRSTQITTEDHPENDMENNDASSSQIIDSSVCDVCKGFDDLNSPRAVVVETTEKYREQGRYLYIYMHHLNFRTLQGSAGGGCEICTVIFDELRSYGDIPKEFAATSSQAQSTAGPQPKSVVPGAQFDEDIFIATRLAELAKQDYSKQVKDEMMSMKVYCDEPTGPRRSEIWIDPIRLYIGVSEEPSISFSYFNTPCAYQVQKGRRIHPDNR